jgi:hypothetical protein
MLNQLRTKEKLSIVLGYLYQRRVQLQNDERFKKSFRVYDNISKIFSFIMKLNAKYS